MIKTIFFFLLCLFLFDIAVAQKNGSVYYIKASGYLVATKDGADFILTILPPDTSIDKDMFVVKEYYLNGKIRFIGNSRTNKLAVIDPKSPNFYKPALQGTCISFFPNGHKMKVENFENGNPVGDETEYYPNGKLYCTKTHTVEKKLLCNDCRDSTGKVLVENGNGKWLTFIDEHFKDYVEGSVISGFEEGDWYGKRNDTINIVYQYQKGELKSSADIDKSGQKTYWKLEVVPEFPGGIDGFYRYLGKNIHYPGVARQNGIQGRVILHFTVESDGTLTDVKVVRGIGGGCDEEALRVIKACQAWKPGMQDGKAVRCAYTVPIQFTL